MGHGQGMLMLKGIKKLKRQFKKMLKNGQAIPEYSAWRLGYSEKQMHKFFGYRYNPHSRMYVRGNDGR